MRSPPVQGPERHQAVWLSIRKRPQDNGIEHSEHGRTGTNAQCQCQCSRDCEPLCFSKLPKGVPGILHQQVEWRKCAPLP